MLSFVPMKPVLCILSTALLGAMLGCQSDKAYRTPGPGAKFDEAGFMAVVDDATAAMGTGNNTQTIETADAIMLPGDMKHVGVILDTSVSMRANAANVFNPEVTAVLKRVVEMSTGADRVWFLDADGRALIGGAQGVPGGGAADHAEALDAVSEDLIQSGSDPTLAIIAALRHYHSTHAGQGGILDLVVVSDELVVRDAMPLERLMSIGGMSATRSNSGQSGAGAAGGIQARVHFIQLPVDEAGPEEEMTAEALSIYSQIVSHKFHGFSYRMAQP